MTKSRHLGLGVLAVVLSILCVLSVASPLAASAAEDVKNQSLTTLVRYRAYFSASVIGQMEDGTEVTVLGETRDFYKVDCYDMQGYIAKSQIVLKEDEKYYVNCVEGSTETGVVNYTAYAQALAMRHGLFELAKEQIGSRYVYGSARPGAFDCSGLTSYLYAQYGISIHRTASSQLQDGIIVAKAGMQVGDLVFFRVPGEYTISSHVGIYVGNNQVIHSGRNGVEFADLDSHYFREYFQCARRIVNTDGASLETAEPITAPTAVPAAMSRRTR